MKKNYKVIAILVSLLIGVTFFAGCGEDENDISSVNSDISNTNSNDSQGDEGDLSKSESSDITESNDESSDPDGDYDESQHDLSYNESSSEVSYDESQNAQNASEVQSASEQSRSSGNENFDSLFKDNKLDTDYIADSKNTDTTEAMVRNMISYKELWVKEAENANNQLQNSSLSDEEKQIIQSDYDEWVAGLSTKEQEILDNEKKKWPDGTIYRVNAVEKSMQYCRDYAAELYKKLFEATGSFELLYK